MLRFSEFQSESGPYYNGTSTGGHYITIRAINGESGTAHIVDPHYSDAYFGDHVIYYDQLCAMLNGRYIIYTSSYAWLKKGSERYEKKNIVGSFGLLYAVLPSACGMFADVASDRVLRCSSGVFGGTIEGERVAFRAARKAAGGGRKPSRRVYGSDWKRKRLIWWLEKNKARQRTKNFSKMMKSVSWPRPVKL